jgi:hypothetical protein
MTDARKKAAAETTACPWCSAAVPIHASTCPSCGAALRDAADGDVAGVTQVDMAATTRLARMKPPGRIAQWLGAERTTDNPDLSGRIEPPSDAVKQEMLRLELAAIDAEIEAKNALLEAERSLPPEEGGTGAAARPAASAAPTAPGAPAAPTAVTPPTASAEGATEEASAEGATEDAPEGSPSSEPG